MSTAHPVENCQVCIFAYVRMRLGRIWQKGIVSSRSTLNLMIGQNGFDPEVDKAKNFIFTGKLVKKLPRWQALDLASSALRL
jgi:hypothetical protein